MTDVPAKSVKSVAKKAGKTPTKSDETLIQDAKERIMRLQVWSCQLIRDSIFLFLNGSILTEKEKRRKI